MAIIDGAFTEVKAISMTEQTNNVFTPDTGKWKVFFKSDGIYIIDDAGVVTGPLISAAGVPSLAATLVTHDTFANLNAWTSVSGSWSVSNNVLTKNGSGNALLRYNTAGIGACIMEVEINFPSDPAGIQTAGLIHFWDGASQNNSVLVRLARNSGGYWRAESEKASLIAYTSTQVGGIAAFSTGSWYKLRADFTQPAMSKYYFNDTYCDIFTPFFVAPTLAESLPAHEPKYIGLRCADGAQSINFRNFKLWTPPAYTLP